MQAGVDASPWACIKNLLFGKIFAENCMKMKEIEPRPGHIHSAPLGSANVEDNKKLENRVYIRGPVRF